MKVLPLYTTIVYLHAPQNFQPKYVQEKDMREDLPRQPYVITDPAATNGPKVQHLS